MLVGITFIAFDYAKSFDELLAGASIFDAIGNLFVPILGLIMLSSALAVLTSTLQGYRFCRSAQVLAIFTFLTINLWSLKVGFAAQIRDLMILERLTLAGGVGLLTLIASGYLASRFRNNIPWIDAAKRPIFKLTIMTLGLSFSSLFLAHVLRPTLPAGLSDRKPNIIMVTFDTLSAHNLALYGYSRNTAPNIENFAKDCIVFDDFRTNYSTTGLAHSALQGVLAPPLGKPNHVTNPGIFGILAQAYPYQGYYGYYPAPFYFKRTLPYNRITRSGEESLLYRLLNRLFPARSLVYTSHLLSAEFHSYWPFNSEYDDDIFWRTNHFPSRLSFQAALNHLKAHPEGSFVWVHTWEPHYPYWPDADLAHKFGPWSATPPEFINRLYFPSQQPWVDELTNRYDAYIATADRNFGHFLSELKAQGIYDNSILIVGADHGESHSQGFIGHSGGAIVESITQIPMLIHPPGRKGQTRVAVRACQLDLAPTLLDLLGFPPSATLPGQSLLPFIKNPQLKDSRILFSISYSAYLGEGGDIALYKDHYKVVYRSDDPSKVSLFNLQNDPQAQKDIAAKHPDLVEEIMTESGAR